MDWKSLGESIAKLGLPILGTALGGPAGATIGAAVARSVFGDDKFESPSAIAAALGDPEILARLKEFEVREKQMLLEHNVAIHKSETERLQAVNATMQAEAKSEHWMQWSWRPYCGFVLGTMVLGCYFVLPLLQIAPPVVPTEAWMALGAVLGVASWHRGTAKVRKLEL